MGTSLQLVRYLIMILNSALLCQLSLILRLTPSGLWLARTLWITSTATTKPLAWCWLLLEVGFLYPTHTLMTWWGVLACSSLLTIYYKDLLVTVKRGFKCMDVYTPLYTSAKSDVLPVGWFWLWQHQYENIKATSHAVWSCLRLSDWLHTAVCGGNINVWHLRRPY